MGKCHIFTVAGSSGTCCEIPERDIFVLSVLKIFETMKQLIQLTNPRKWRLCLCEPWSYHRLKGLRILWVFGALFFFYIFTNSWKCCEFFGFWCVEKQLLSGALDSLDRWTETETTLCPKKRSTLWLSISSPKINRFSKFFHWCILWTISNKAVVKYFATH